MNYEEWDERQQAEARYIARWKYYLGYYDADPELFDQDAPIVNALEKESLLRWEHELSQPDYYDYFLEEMTRC